MKHEYMTPLPDSVRAEAAAWVARLHSSPRSRAVEAALRRWLAADPDHSRAFEIATEAWEIGGSVRPMAVTRIVDPFMDAIPRTRDRRRYVAIAATLLVMLVGTLIFLQWQTPISTGVGEQRMLTLTDGTRIFLNTDTRLFVQEDASQRRVRLDSGEALFEVTKNPRRPFVVTAGGREVVALGTAFVVRSDTQQLSVTLMEGKVAVATVSDTARAKTVLTPGQRLTFRRRNPPQLDEPAMATVTAWRRGEIILDKTRLQDAVIEMNRYSAIKLVIEDSQVADIRVSGIFRAGDAVRFAYAVSETYHLVIAPEPQRILISGLRMQD